MDRTDLQELIKTIAARLRQADGREAEAQTGRSEAVTDVTSFANPQTLLPTADVQREGDVARLIAELLAGIPAPAESIDRQASTAAGRVAPAEGDDSGPLARIARSLVTGLGVVSLVKGIFGADDSSAPAAPALAKFEMPLPIRQDVAYSSRTGEYIAFDRPEAGGVRARETAAPAAITVNVQAMDSKSFLDHSHEIARAVREAILNSNSLNDVVSEL